MKASDTPGKFLASGTGNCHDHVLPARVGVDPDARARAFEQKVIDDHYRWAKMKARRIAARKARKINWKINRA